MTSSGDDRTLPAAFAAATTLAHTNCPGIYKASALLPKTKRQEICAVAAFGQMIHHAIVDPTEGEPAGRMAMVEQRISDIEQDRLELPNVEFRTPEQHALAAAAWVIRQYQLPRQALLDIGEAGLMELTVRRYATWNSLQTYCRLSSASIAVLMLAVLGAQHSEAKDRAIELATAIRLTEILRDLSRDVQQGRLLLPLEDMIRFGYSDRDLEKKVVNENFVLLMKFEIQRARDLYRRGSEGICWLGNDRARLFVSAIAIGSSDLLREIERAEYDVFASPISAPIGMTISRLMRTWKLARRKADHPLPDVF